MLQLSISGPGNPRQSTTLGIMSKLTRHYTSFVWSADELEIYGLFEEFFNASSLAVSSAPQFVDVVPS